MIRVVAGSWGLYPPRVLGLWCRDRWTVDTRRTNEARRFSAPAVRGPDLASCDRSANDVRRVNGVHSSSNVSKGAGGFAVRRPSIFVGQRSCPGPDASKRL